MRRMWNAFTLREKVTRILDILILLGMLVLYILYFVRILDHNATTFAWCLFPFHFFLNAFGKWKTDREEALRNLMLGGFVSIVSLIGFTAFLMAYL